MGQFDLLSTTEKLISKHALKQMSVALLVVFLQTGIRMEPSVRILFDCIDLECSSVSLAEWNWVFQNFWLNSLKSSSWNNKSYCDGCSLPGHFCLGCMLINPIWNAEIFCITRNELQILDSCHTWDLPHRQIKNVTEEPVHSFHLNTVLHQSLVISSAFPLFCNDVCVFFLTWKCSFPSTTYSTYVTAYNECSEQSEMIVS